MNKQLCSAWFFLALSFGAMAGTPHGKSSAPAHYKHHENTSMTVADVAETPDEHIQEPTLAGAKHH